MTRGTDVTDMKRTYRTAVKGEFPKYLRVRLKKESDLRYGENPNQPAAMYSLRRGFVRDIIDKVKGRKNLAELTNIRLAKSGKEGLS